MFETILLPSDGSECARTATAHAAALADYYDATVHVLTVMEAPEGDVGVDEDREAARDRAVGPIVADLRSAGVETASSIAAGLPEEEILATIEAVGADLVAMGTHGRSGLRRHVLGSVTERVLRQADVPVLTVPETEEGASDTTYDDVLVPTDGSEGANAAAPTAIDLAGAFDATLHALSVVDTAPAASDIRASVFIEEFETVAEAAVTDLEAQATDAGLDRVQTAVVRGTPHEVIRSYVNSNDVDLVVMGTHGRSGLDRYLLGSVAENVIRTSSVPVLAVRYGEAE